MLISGVVAAVPWAVVLITTKMTTDRSLQRYKVYLWMYDISDGFAARWSWLLLGKDFKAAACFAQCHRYDVMSIGCSACSGLREHVSCSCVWY